MRGPSTANPWQTKNPKVELLLPYPSTPTPSVETGHRTHHSQHDPSVLVIIIAVIAGLSGQTVLKLDPRLPNETPICSVEDF